MEELVPAHGLRVGGAGDALHDVALDLTGSVASRAEYSPGNPVPLRRPYVAPHFGLGRLGPAGPSISLSAGRFSVGGRPPCARSPDVPEPRDVRHMQLPFGGKGPAPHSRSHNSGVWCACAHALPPPVCDAFASDRIIESIPVCVCSGSQRCERAGAEEQAATMDHSAGGRAAPYLFYLSPLGETAQSSRQCIESWVVGPSFGGLLRNICEQREERSRSAGTMAGASEIFARVRSASGAANEG